MNSKIFLFMSVSVVLAVGAGVGVEALTDAPLAGAIASALVAGLGVFACARVLCGAMMQRCAVAIGAVAQNPSSPLEQGNAASNIWVAGLDELRQTLKSALEFKEGILRGLPMGGQYLEAEVRGDLEIIRIIE